MKAYAVIMAGGVGTRFWPLSRKGHPKQLLSLEQTQKPLIQITYERIKKLIPPSRIIVVTSQLISNKICSLLPEIPKDNILEEPQGRNTSPCVGWAAIHINKRSPQALMAVLPADHLILNQERFLEAVKSAFELAKKKYLVTIGIKPTRPETGYGYIERGENILDLGYKVKRFIEKPDINRAKRFLKKDKYLWNSGMFFFRTDIILKEISSHLPSLYHSLQRINKAMDKGKEKEEINQVYPQLEPISIDYGVMEKSRHIAVIPVDFGWNDIGSWESVWQLRKTKESDNIIISGKVVTSEAEGNLFYSFEDKIIVALGIKDLVIINTKDALLVCPRNQSQKVKKMVEELKKQALEKYL
jgi:mannose-1-phosphate guanylyltransferase